MPNILILGGTTEASALAQAIASAGLPATLSYAGRVAEPKHQPIPIRTGGFGGVAGLTAYLQSHGITHLVDATHPFAAQMSLHAVEASRQCAVALMALERPPWVPQPGDRWQRVTGIEGAVAALDQPARVVFLAIGRQHLAAFAARPQHHFILRLVDEPPGPIPLARATALVARGPFDLAGDLALISAHAIDIIVAKNSGGTGAEAKLIAARQLGLPVILIDRPFIPSRPVAGSVAEVMRWLGHPALRGV